MKDWEVTIRFKRRASNLNSITLISALNAHAAVEAVETLLDIGEDEIIRINVQTAKDKEGA